MLALTPMTINNIQATVEVKGLLFMMLLFIVLFSTTLSDAAAATTLPPKPKTEKLSTKPNILLITADDMGFDDRGSQNPTQLSTPSLDKLAQQSLQFSDFNVTPVCSTTRASLLTGRHFYKTGVSGVHGGRDYLHLSETLLPQVLKDNGYRTGTWGKWHLGKTKGYLPEDRGFDDAYYAELYLHNNSQGFLNGKPVKHNKWASEVISDYAIDFMADSTEQPFFAYVSFLAPHEPWLAPDKYVQPLIKAGARPAIANLYGMVEEMDFHIGRLLSFLEENNLAENTIVIFLSDNGPWWDSSNFGAMTQAEWRARNPSKMKGNKGQTWQNGIRSPLFIRWQSHWQATTINRYSDVKDIFPTLVELAGITLPSEQQPLDGHSLMPLIRNDKTYINPRATYLAAHDVISRKALFNQWTPIDHQARTAMHYQDQFIGLRTEQYKLLLNPSMDRAGYPTPQSHYLLFDMQNDPLEIHNIINKKTAIADDLKQQLQYKFTEFRDSTTTFRAPVFLISPTDPVSVINGFGPSSTGGNTESKAHQLSGLKATADFAHFQIQLQALNRAEFDIYLKLKNSHGAGIKVQLSVGQQSIPHQLTAAKIQKVGTLSISAQDTLLRVEVLENNSYKPWAQISSLRRILLVPKGKNIDLHQLILPQ